MAVEPGGFGIATRRNELKIEFCLVPDGSIKRWSVRGVFDQRNAWVMPSDERPKRLAKFLGVALFAKLIDEILILIVTLPRLDDAAARIRSSVMTWIDAENDGILKKLKLAKTLKILSSRA